MNDASLVVYHTSDVHGRRGFGRALRSIVEPDALLVDCGDALRGSSTVYRRQEPVAREFAEAPYAAQALGNREFHYLHGCVLARARAMPMPWLCSNLIDLRGREPAFARELTVVRNGINVRLLALLAPQYRTGSGWERAFGWRFLAPDRALSELLAGSNAAAATILLSHLGLAADRALAQRFSSLTAIVGGHSHETLQQPEVVAGVPISHAGPYANYAGRLELAIGGGRGVVRNFRLVPLLAAQADAE